MQAMPLKDGLMKYSILSPRHLYHPFLPLHCTKSLLFCLCRSCAIQQNRPYVCSHEMVAGRALTGTWVLDEIRLTVKKGYDLMQFQEVYEYQLTRYDPQTSDGGLFAQYINTFLKLTAEPRRYPSWVQCPEDEDR